MNEQLLCLSNYINYLFTPFVCLTYTNQEINKFLKYKKKLESAQNNEDDKTEPNEIIDKIVKYTNLINWNNDLYSLYLPDKEIIKIYEFIILFYDFNKNCLNYDEIKNNFKIIKKLALGILENRKFNFSDYQFLYKKLSWILKILNVDEKNKIVKLFNLPKDKLFDKQSTTNLICHTIIEECTKLNNYPKYNFVNTRYFTDLCDNDKQLIKPVIEYIKQNPKCINLSDFNINKQIEDYKQFKIKNVPNLKEFNLDKLKSLTKFNKLPNKNKEYILKTFINSNIQNFSVTYVWICYLNAIIYLLMDIENFIKFLDSDEYVKYLVNKENNENDNIKKITDSLCYNIKIGNISNVSKILKSYYPNKYQFLGFTNTIIQPYILFIDIINILTKELKSSKIVKLFKYAVGKQKNKNDFLTYFIKDKKQENVENIKNEEFLKLSDYFVISINNNSYSLDQQNSDIDKKEKCLNYPLVLKLKDNIYYLKSLVLFNKVHHYVFLPLLNNEKVFEFIENEQLVENKISIDGFHYVVHMLVYEIGNK